MNEKYELVLAALHAVSPTGGGSPQRALYLELLEQWGMKESDSILRQSARLQISTFQEINELLDDETTLEDLEGSIN